MRGVKEMKEKQSGEGSDRTEGYAATCIPVPPGVFTSPAPALPSPGAPQRTHVHTAGAEGVPCRDGDRDADPRSAGGAHAEFTVLLGCLGMMQGHPRSSQRRHQLLKCDGGLRNCYSIFTHLFLCISNKQGQLTFRTTLGSRKMVISIK